MKEVKDGFFWIDPDEFAGLRARREVTLVRRCIKDLEVGDHVVAMYLAPLTTREDLERFVNTPRDMKPVTGRVEVVKIIPISTDWGNVGNVVVRVAQHGASVPQPPPNPVQVVSEKIEVPK